MPSLFRYLLPLLLLLPSTAPSARADVVTDYATGKCGRYLLSVLQVNCRPMSLQPAERQAQLLLSLYDVSSADHLPDYLGDTTVGDGLLRASNHILAEWFNTSNDDSQQAATDLFNLFPTTATLRNLRADLPLLDGADSSAVGLSTTVDGKYIIYQPAPTRKGELARMAFYVAAIYGRASAWQGNGAIIFNDFQTYPLLSKRAIEQFLLWHSAYPVTDEELARAQRAEALQGNINPFITHPELVDHIWGSLSSEPYIPSSQPNDNDDTGDGDNPSDPPSPDPIPLHPYYGLSDTIYLYSPYVDGDASWTIDGTPVLAASINATDIGVGQHEIRFTSSGQSGKLLITVRP